MMKSGGEVGMVDMYEYGKGGANFCDRGRSLFLEGGVCKGVESGTS